MTIDAPLDARPAAVPTAPVNSLLTSPILPTLLKLSLPNTIAMFGAALVAVAETSYIGRLGLEPLAGIALVFPFTMLTQMMSAGVLEQACAYSTVLFSGAVSIWLVNTLASMLRGTGDMKLPSATLIVVAIVQ